MRHLLRCPECCVHSCLWRAAGSVAGIICLFGCADQADVVPLRLQQERHIRAMQQVACAEPSLACATRRRQMSFQLSYLSNVIC